MNAKDANIPTIIVVFGATGDLMAKKITPALFNLFGKKKLPRLFKTIGFSRRDLSDEKFREYVSEKLSKNEEYDKKDCVKFCESFSYQQGQFQNQKDYRELAKQLKAIDDEWGVCSNKLFYLAVPPQFYETIFKNLAESGLPRPCGDKESWSRVLVEKPFGKDLKTAERLDKLLGTLFQEEQIYRIDHYLAKEMIQNILAFRFSNNLFERTWDKNSIEKVEIKLWEKIGVEDRGSFYNQVGALRDVGQNHLLQMVALLTMEHPERLSAESIREKRMEVLKTLALPTKEEIKNFTFRSQYEGYQNIKEVTSDSTIETYFKVRAFLSHPRWSGIPFILESGKRLKEQVKEAIITFRHPEHCFCPAGQKHHYKNKIIITLEPEEKITMVFWSKKPGLKFELEEREFSFLMRKANKKNQYAEEYEKLLYDCIIGDQTLFVTSGEVAAMWKYIDSIIVAWKKNAVPLKTYQPDSDSSIIESSWINDGDTPTKKEIKKEICVIGLGKMGRNISRRLMEKGWRTHGHDTDPETIKKMEGEGLRGIYLPKEIKNKLSSPRIVWLMVPAGKAIDEIIFGKEGLVNFLNKGDIIVDGGNSFYKDSVRRSQKLNKLGIHFTDVGVSGGPKGARFGASLMVGGDKKVFQKLETLFGDIASIDGYRFFEGAGAGHFIKMVHNGIEYGMMQAIAEGFTILKKSKYKLDFAKVADIYNHGSVIESRLIGWLKDALQLHGDDLKNVSGSVGHTGEGAWTIKTAKGMKIKAKVIEEALNFRIISEKKPSHTGKILSALREQFGGHSISDKKSK